MGISTFKRGMKATCTKPPRTREGLNKTLSHNSDPTGGKKLRKARYCLAARCAVFDALRDPTGYTKPGAM